MYPSCTIGPRLGTTLITRCYPRTHPRLPVIEHTKAPKLMESSLLKATARIGQLNGRRNSPKTSKLKKAQLKQLQPEPTKPDTTEPAFQTAVQKITYFQAKLLEIQGNMKAQIINLDGVAKAIGVEADRLHPFVHCKHILQFDISSALQELLQAITDTAPKQKKHTTQEDSTAIWLEFRILAVQLWIVKRLLLQTRLEIDDEMVHAQARSSLQDIETQISEMSLVVATLRDTFHRVRPERAGQLPREGWANNLFVKDNVEDDLESPDPVSATESSQSALSQRNHTGAPVSQSILLDNLAIVAAYSRQESATWKIERFLSRIEEVYHRVSRVIGCLDQLTQSLQVAQDRTHPVVSCKHVLQLDSFSSLDMMLRILRKRTPKNQIELDQGMGQALWLNSRLPEVQLEVVKIRLWAFHSTMKSQDLPRQQKALIRSIRGRMKVAHSLLRNSREEFGLYGSQGKFGIGEDILNKVRV
ncbi:unnamed protein product [Rhizoctonia solani]|uniref:Uncharacterized protein n=1 Tax=Rhizoctonia solani TaxID=456999 RepID=A0A8H3DFE5_9AGAM|nr:unnamed protein product [Rhizoctonia solani]